MVAGEQAAVDLAPDRHLGAHPALGDGVEALHPERQPVQDRGGADGGVDDAHGHRARVSSSSGECTSLRAATVATGSAVADRGPSMQITRAR